MQSFRMLRAATRSLQQSTRFPSTLAEGNDQRRGRYDSRHGSLPRSRRVTRPGHRPTSLHSKRLPWSQLRKSVSNPRKIRTTLPYLQHHETRSSFQGSLHYITRTPPPSYNVGTVIVPVKIDVRYKSLTFEHYRSRSCPPPRISRSLVLSFNPAPSKSLNCMQVAPSLPRRARICSPMAHSLQAEQRLDG